MQLNSKPPSVPVGMLIVGVLIVSQLLTEVMPLTSKTPALGVVKTHPDGIDANVTVAPLNELTSTVNTTNAALG